jgi:hypothetical protein
VIDPLIYTTKGNVPVSALKYETAWENTPDYIKFMERYTLNGEVVRESAHVYQKKPLSAELIGSF